jgi:hypothetical protein
VSTLSRPTLIPGLRPLWRHKHAVQLGTDPAQAMVLELPHPAAAKLLDLLDGSRTERVILREMSRIGMSEQDVLAIIGNLSEAGLVVPASSLMPAALAPEQRHRIAREATALALRFRDRPASPASILRRRQRARVIVAGAGHLARLLTQALLDSGVGTVGQVTEPGATAQEIAESPAQGRPVRSAGSFVVQIGAMSRTPLPGVRHRLPHLALNIRDAVAIVGPLVPASGGPCLICLDLHRTDRDPAWPRLAEQLAEGNPAPPPCAAATALTAAGYAAAEVLAYLDGESPTTIGTTVEIHGTSPWRRRNWTLHPKCDCTRRRR